MCMSSAGAAPTMPDAVAAHHRSDAFTWPRARRVVAPVAVSSRRHLGGLVVPLLPDDETHGQFWARGTVGAQLRRAPALTVVDNTCESGCSRSGVLGRRDGSRGLKTTSGRQ